MDIQQRKCFNAVAQIGKISAPALSMAISRLEKELGVRLYRGRLRIKAGVAERLIETGVELMNKLK